MKKFNQVWISQTNLGKKFELSAIEVGKILIEHQLKDPKTGLATQRAMDGGYAKSTPLKNGTPFFMWHLEKTKALISIKHAPLSGVDYWINEVKNIFREAEKLLDEGQDKQASLMYDFAYEEVPEKFVNEVRARIEAENNHS